MVGDGEDEEPEGSVSLACSVPEPMNVKQNVSY